MVPLNSKKMPDRSAWFRDSLKAGETVYSRVANDDRPAWAAGILSACCDPCNSVPDALTHVVLLAGDRSRWPEAHDAFSAVRQLTLAAERSCDDDPAHYLLYVAENAAKVIYNASGSSAPFDGDSGAWLVRCAQEFASRLSNDEFTERLWGVIAKHAGDPGQSKFVANVSLKLLVLKTHDVDSLCRFYKLLGFTFTEERHGSGPVHFSTPLGDAVMEIYPLASDQSVDTTTRLGFAIADTDAVVAGVESLGGRIIKTGRDTPWGYLAIVGDPDGRTVELYRDA